MAINKAKPIRVHHSLKLGGKGLRYIHSRKKRIINPPSNIGRGMRLNIANSTEKADNAAKKVANPALTAS